MFVCPEESVQELWIGITKLQVKEIFGIFGFCGGIHHHSSQVASKQISKSNVMKLFCCKCIRETHRQTANHFFIFFSREEERNRICMLTHCLRSHDPEKVTRSDMMMVTDDSFASGRTINPQTVTQRKRNFRGNVNKLRKLWEVWYDELNSGG